MDTETLLQLISPIVAAYILSRLVTDKRVLVFVLLSCFLYGTLSGTNYLVNAMTGEGFNEAAWYHVQNAQGDILMVFAYKEAYHFVANLILSVLCYAWIYRAWNHPVKRTYAFSRNFATVVAPSAFLAMHPLIQDVNHTLAVSGFEFQDRIGIQQEVAKTKSYGDFQVSSPEAQRDLVVIYGESLEHGFFQESRFPGMMRETKDQFGDALVFDDVQQVPLGEWTIAGMMASQCGTSMLTPANKQTSHEDVDDNNNCLGTILKHAGFRKRLYMGGADIGFAAKGNFYKETDFDEVIGLDDFRSEAKETSIWGVYDDFLFGKFKARYAAELKKPGPFAMVTLTLDTHPPEGHLTPWCQANKIQYGDGTVPHLNAVKCADHLVADLIRHVRGESQKAGRALTLVFLSDHIMMNSPGANAVRSSGAERKNIVAIWDDRIKPGVSRRPAIQFDTAATLAHLITMDWKPRAIQSVGLGRSLLGEDKTLIEKYGKDNVLESVKAYKIRGTVDLVSGAKMAAAN